MCGIVGVIEFGGSVSLSTVALMRDTMVHRGPDDTGLWCSPRGDVGFGHRRLSILDLSAAGRQPMKRGGYCITFNGEIYNHADLRSKLELLGHRFTTRTDTEVILAAYREWGERCVVYLSGMFAFAIYDENNQTVFMARDRAGEKPLYYSHVGGRFIFGSELKALMAHPQSERRLDPDALNVFLGYGYVPGSMSILRGHHKLRPGHAMTVDLRTQAVKQWCYWQLPDEPFEDITLEEATDVLDSLLRTSVAQQLQADVPVAILLSGGIDSSLVTALASSVSGKTPRTFTISFPGHGKFDEAVYARMVADHFGTEHVEIVAEPIQPDGLATLARQYDEPMADFSMIPTYMVSKAVRQHATVALGGDGGDELFGGYKHYSWLQKLQPFHRFTPRTARKLAAFAARRMPTGAKAKTYLVGMDGDIDRMLSHVDLFFDHEGRASLLSPALREQVTLEPELYKQRLKPSGSLLRKATTLDFHTFMVDDVLCKVDRASMLTSLEVRAPFLSPAAIEFAFRLPDHLRATVAERKIVPRNLAARYLPEQMDLRRKQGFTVPINAWLTSSPTRESFREILLDGDADIVDKATVERLLDLQDKGYTNGKRIFALAMLEMWRREYSVTV